MHCPSCGRDALLATDYHVPFTLSGPEDRFDSYSAWLPYENKLGLRGPRMATISAPELANKLGIGGLWVIISGHSTRHGSEFETGTFKECEAIGVLNRVREQTQKILIVSSAGNAGRAFLEFSAQYSEPAIVVMPAGAKPLVKHVVSNGISPLLVLIEDSHYPDAIRFVDEAVARFPDDLVREGGCFNVARRDSMGVPFLRAIRAIGQLPDWYVQAVGSGTGAIAAWEAAKRLQRTTSAESPAMRLLLVQNSPFAPMVGAWRRGERQIALLSDEEIRSRLGQVAARVLSNATPPYAVTGGVYDSLQASRGEMIAVENQAIFAAQDEIQRSLAFRPCEAAAAAYAGLKKACLAGAVATDHLVVLHLTGGGIEALRAEGAVHSPLAEMVRIGNYSSAFEKIRRYIDQTGSYRKQ